MNNLQAKKEVVKKTTTSATSEKIAQTETPKKPTNAQLPMQNDALSQFFSPVTAEQRIKNLEIFKKLAEKHEFLREKADNLNAFLVSRDGMKEKLTITSDANVHFEISNSIIIEQILNLCVSKLDELIEQSNQQILTYNI